MLGMEAANAVFLSLLVSSNTFERNFLLFIMYLFLVYLWNHPLLY